MNRTNPTNADKPEKDFRFYIPFVLVITGLSGGAKLLGVDNWFSQSFGLFALVSIGTIFEFFWWKRKQLHDK